MAGKMSRDCKIKKRSGVVFGYTTPLPAGEGGRKANFIEGGEKLKGEKIVQASSAYQ